MAKYIILPSRHNKNTCRHGEIYYLTKSTSEKLYVVMTRYHLMRCTIGNKSIARNWKCFYYGRLVYQKVYLINLSLQEDVGV